LIDQSSKDSDSGVSLESLPELIEKLESKMKITAKDLDFEKAAILRDRIKKLRHRLIGR
jgi:excinuclease ABC subunit B